MPVLNIFRGRANLRNHRKLVVVDSRSALTGGMNLAWPYIGPPGSTGLWRDLSVVVEGPAVLRARLTLRIGLEIRHRQGPQQWPAARFRALRHRLRVDRGSGRRQRPRRRGRPALRIAAGLDLRGADANLDRHTLLRSRRNARPGAGPGSPPRGRRPRDSARALEPHHGRSRPRQLPSRPPYRRRPHPASTNR